MRKLTSLDVLQNVRWSNLRHPASPQVRRPVADDQRCAVSDPICDESRAFRAEQGGQRVGPEARPEPEAGPTRTSRRPHATSTPRAKLATPDYSPKRSPRHRWVGPPPCTGDTRRRNVETRVAVDCRTLRARAAPLAIRSRRRPAVIYALSVRAREPKHQCPDRDRSCSRDPPGESCTSRHRRSRPLRWRGALPLRQDQPSGRRGAICVSRITRR
jgi:hypothetical protein